MFYINYNPFPGTNYVCKKLEYWKVQAFFLIRKQNCKGCDTNLFSFSTCTKILICHGTKTIFISVLAWI